MTKKINVINNNECESYYSYSSDEEREHSVSPPKIQQQKRSFGWYLKGLVYTGCVVATTYFTTYKYYTHYGYFDPECW